MQKNSKLSIKKEYLELPLDQIYPYPNNPRLNEKAIAYVAESIRQTGNLDPIEIDENNVILSGHTRRKALEHLGITATQVIRYTGLTAEQKNAYRLLTNKTAEVATWENTMLFQELEPLHLGKLKDLFPSFAPDDVHPVPKAKDLRPVKYAHFLISVPLKKVESILSQIQKLKETADVESTLNEKD